MKQKLSGKKRLLLGLSAFALFGVAAATTFFAIPQKVSIEHVAGPDDGDGLAALTGRERFIGNLAEGATAGLKLDVKHLKFDQFYTGENAKAGHNTIEVTESNPGRIYFAMNELSLHGINFALDLPISYSDNGYEAKNRGIYASLINDDIYLDLFDNGDAAYVVPDLEENGEIPARTTSTWDFKYHVSAAASQVNPSVNSIDSLTRGAYYYEYGELDWLIEVILETLSEGGISVSLEGWLNNLTGSSSTSDDSTSDTSLTDKILASMDEMKEYEVSSKPYFVWNLPISDNKTIPLGFASSSDYNLTGIDLPAKLDINGGSPDSAVWNIQDGMTLQAEITVDGTSDINWNQQVRGEASSYKELKNSRELFEGIAKVIAKPEVGVSVGLDLKHATSNNREADRTHLKKQSVNEDAYIKIDANLDAFVKGNPLSTSTRSLEGLDANIEIGEGTIQTHDSTKANKIGVAYLKEVEEGNEVFNGYLNVNDVIKAKSGWTYLHEFYTNTIAETFTGVGDSLSLDQFEKLLGSIGDSINAIKNSKVLKAIDKGAYNGLLDLLTLFKNADNQILIELGLSPLGLTGTVSLTLDGVDENLLNLTFNNVRFASLTLNGSVKSVAFDQPKAPVFDASVAKNYETISHLKGIGGQIKSLVDSKSFKANLAGSIAKGDKQTLAIGGDIAVKFNGETSNGKGGAKLTLKQMKNEANTQDHNIALDFQEGFTDIFFHYDSYSTTAESSAKTSKGINGFINVEAAKKVFNSDNFDFDFLIDFFKNDDRFSRLGTALMSESSLIGDILNGEYFGLLEARGILKTVSLGSSTSVIINGPAIGLKDTTIALDITYLPSSGEEEGGIDTLKVTITKAPEEGESTVISFTVSGIEAVAENEEISFISSYEGFDDYSPLAEMGRDLINTLTVGTYMDNGTFGGVSNYGIEGSIGLDIAGYGMNVYQFNADASVEGAETKIYASFPNLPVIRGINGPDDEHYFRPNEIEGKRNSEIFFYANGVDPEGSALILRDSSYGRLRNVQDAVKVGGKDLLSNLLGYIGEYAIGLNESLFTPSEEATTTTSNEESASAKGIHIDDAWTGFKSVETTDGRDYIISLDLGELVGVGILDEIVVTIHSRKVTSTNYSEKILTGLDAELNVKATASNILEGNEKPNQLYIASAKVSLNLTNISGSNQIEAVCGENSRFAQIYVGNVHDSGLLYDNDATDEEVIADARGSLFELKNGFQGELDTSEGTLNNYYGYNYTLENATAPESGFNHYIYPTKSVTFTIDASSLTNDASIVLVEGVATVEGEVADYAEEVTLEYKGSLNAVKVTIGEETTDEYSFAFKAGKSYTIVLGEKEGKTIIAKVLEND